MQEQKSRIKEAYTKWLHLHWYVYSNDSDRRRKVNWAIVGLALGLVSAVGVGWTTIPAIVSSAATIAGILVALASLAAEGSTRLSAAEGSKLRTGTADGGDIG
jgi:hypothetical protein